MSLVRDDNNPNINISSPLNNSFVKGIFDIKVNTSDLNLSNIEFYINGSLVFIDRGINGSFKWNSTNGSYSDAIYTIKLIYYKQQTKLATGSATNNWSIEAPYMLIGKAGSLLAMNNRDKMGLQLFTALYADAARRTGLLSEAREHAGAVYVRGGAD